MNSSSRRGLRTSLCMQGPSLSMQKILSIKASSAIAASQVSRRAIPDEIIRQPTEWPSGVKPKFTRMTALSLWAQRCGTSGNRLTYCNTKGVNISENLVRPTIPTASQGDHHVASPCGCLTAPSGGFQKRCKNI